MCNDLNLQLVWLINTKNYNHVQQHSNLWTILVGQTSKIQNWLIKVCHVDIYQYIYWYWHLTHFCSVLAIIGWTNLSLSRQKPKNIISPPIFDIPTHDPPSTKPVTYNIPWVKKQYSTCIYCIFLHSASTYNKHLCITRVGHLHTLFTICL